MLQIADTDEQYYLLEIVSDSLRSQSELPEEKREVLATLVDNVKASLRSQKPEARSQKPEARSQKPEARSQKPEARSQKIK